MIDEFADAEQGGFFFTGNRHEALIARQKDVHDNATPSGNGMAATALIRLGALTGRDRLTQAGRRALESVQSLLERQPAAAGQSLIALDFLLGSIREFAVIAGADPAEFRAVLEAIATPFRPHKVVAPATPAAGGLRSPISFRCSPTAQSAMAEQRPTFANTSPAASRSLGLLGVEAALADRKS